MTSVRYAKADGNRPPKVVAEFVEGYNGLAGAVRYSVADAKSGALRVFYLGGAMVGGYLINDSRPYRTLGWIRDEPPLAADLAGLVERSTFAEVNALWIAAEVPNAMRAAIYCMSIIDAARSKPDYILGGCFEPTLFAMQRRALPNLLWHGRSQPFGLSTRTWVMYAKPGTAIARLPYSVALGLVSRRSRRAGRRRRTDGGQARKGMPGHRTTRSAGTDARRRDGP